MVVNFQSPGDIESAAIESASAGDRRLLGRLRWWLTYEQEPTGPSDGGGLEVWSAFDFEDQYAIARVRSVGTGDAPGSRAECVLWPRSLLGPGCEPLTLLGSGAAILGSEPCAASVAPAPEGWPSAAALVRWEPEVWRLERFLSGTIQALQSGRPVVLATPFHAFLADCGIADLLSFVCAALPGVYKRRLRLRLYSRAPGVFLRQEAASILVIPEDVLAGAIAASPEVLVMDYEGQLRLGEQPDARAQAYARALIEAAWPSPRGLLRFAEHFDPGRLLAVGTPADVEANVRCRYRMLDLTAQAEGSREVLCDASIQQADVRGSVVWTDLLVADEWLALSPGVLFDCLMETAAADSSAARIQEALETTFQRAGRILDGPWQLAEGCGSLARLVHLACLEPPVCSPQALVRSLTGVGMGELLGLVPIGSLIDSGLLDLLLGDAPGRGRDLLGAVAVAEHRQAIVAGVAAGRLRLGPWFQDFLAGIDADLASDLVLDILAEPLAWGAWDPVALALFECLPAEPRWPGTATRRLLAGLGALEPATAPRLFLAVLDLVGALGADGEAGPGLGRLLNAVSTDADHGSAPVVDLLVEGHWRTLGPTLLIAGAGGLRIPPSPALARWLIGDASACAALDGESLAALGALLVEPTPGEVQAVREGLDRCWARRDPGLMRGLIRSGLWLFWLRGSRLGVGQARALALAWLSDPVWEESATLPPTREAWLAVIGLLSRERLREVDCARLARGPVPQTARWPWIPAFEPEQLAELAASCEDLGALARLTEIARAAPPPYDLGRLQDWLAERGPQPGLTGDALSWLGQPPVALPPLGLDQAMLLKDHAGPRAAAAERAWRAALLALLRCDPRRALDAAERTGCWGQAWWLTALREWFLELTRGLQDVGDLLAALDARTWPSGGDRDPQTRRGAMFFAARGLTGIARFLDPLAEHALADEDDLRRLARALRAGQAAPSLWEALAQRVREFLGRPAADRTANDGYAHPARRLAEILDEDPAGAAPEALESSWRQFLAVALEKKDFLEPAMVPGGAGAGPELPVVHLAVATHPRLGLAAIGERLLLATDAEPERFRRPDWLAALRAGLANALAASPARSAVERLSVIEAALDRQVRRELSRRPGVPAGFS